MFIAALFIEAPNWKEPKYQSTGEWINKEILFSDGKHQITDFLNDRDKSQNYAQKKKLR